MKVAHFVGNHSGDIMSARLGWWITKRVQKGIYSGTTHCEAIHAEHSDGSVTIASSSLRDGGVRDKIVQLNPLNWRIVEVPSWDVQLSIDLLQKTRGAGYDLRGAIATVFIGSPQDGRFFCDQWVGTPYMPAPATFGPHQFHALTLGFGRDITSEFFTIRK